MAVCFSFFLFLSQVIRILNRYKGAILLTLTSTLLKNILIKQQANKNCEIKIKYFQTIWIWFQWNLSKINLKRKTWWLCNRWWTINIHLASIRSNLAVKYQTNSHFYWSTPDILPNYDTTPAMWPRFHTCIQYLGC